jgi:hypothetical protein
MIGRPSRRLLTVLAAVLLVAGTTWFTGATFTSGTSGSVSVGAARDYYPPRVSLTAQPTIVSGAVAVSATASDTGSGVARVVVQYAAAGSSTWTSLCTDQTTPYSCTWDTLTVADGDYQLRAIATDNVGSTTTSATITTRVANPAAVELAPIPDDVRGDVVLHASVTGAGTRTVTSTFTYRLAGTTGNWLSIGSCTGLTGLAPTCTWATGTLADTYDVQVESVVGSGGGQVKLVDVQTDVTVDNLAPTVAVDAPTPLSGTVQVIATALDEDSGIRQVELSYKPTLAATWTPLCTVTVEPYRCAFDTTGLDGALGYQLRAIATDVVGNSTTSAVISRSVNNAMPSIAITSPLGGDRVTGNKTITTDHVTAGRTVSGVLLEARPVGNSGWTSLCTATTAPYICDWATAAIVSGSWELRATMTFAGLTGNQSVASPSVIVTVDNSPLRALDVQAANGGLLGKVDGGDSLTFTFAGDVQLGSIRSNWDGTSVTVTVSMLDRAANPTAATDRVSIPGLGTVAFPQNLVRKKKTVPVTASMTATKVTAGGATTTTVVLTFGAVTSGDLSTSTAAGAMVWTPLASIRSTANLAVSTAAATESGASDRDL